MSSLCHPKVCPTSCIPAEVCTTPGHLPKTRVSSEGTTAQKIWTTFAQWATKLCADNFCYILLRLCPLSSFKLNDNKKHFEKLLGDLAGLNLNLDCPDWPDKRKEVWLHRLGIPLFFKMHNVRVRTVLLMGFH